MSIVVAEKLQSRMGDGQSIELGYIVFGTDDDVAARTALSGASPLLYAGMVRDTASIHVEPLGNDLWDGRIKYVLPEDQEPQTGDSVFSFDTGGGTQHITQSLQTIAKYPASTAPDFKGAIGVTHDSVEGVDITVPVYQFSETHYLANSVVTLAYRGALFALTGKTNDASFRGLAAGEGLFLGASGSKRGPVGSDADWEITFRFAGSPNVTGLTIGDITGIDKKGWEYLWVRYADAEDTVAVALVKKPVAVYIEQVYRSGSFATLGIGT